MPRKGIGVLLNTLAALRKEIPQLRLVRVGGPFTREQRNLVDRLDLTDAVQVVPFLSKPVLAAVYRRAALVVVPSSREGFGLPVVEAMACGTPTLVSGISALHEVGGTAAAYAPVDDVPAWTAAAISLLHERRLEPDRWARRQTAGIQQAAKFTWAEYARKMVDVYRRLS